MPAKPVATREARALRLSVWAGAAAAALGIVWGVVTGSRAVLFDGVFSIIGIVMSGVSLGAARAVQQGISATFPYGREALVPLTVGMQGIARLGLALYAIGSSVVVIRDGGAEVPTWSAVGYSAVILLLCLVVGRYLSRIAAASDLVRLEAIGWRVASWMAGVMVVGFGAVALLPAGDLHDSLARYVDPVMVIVSSILVLPVPIRLLRTTSRELLEMAPPDSISAPVRTSIGRICADNGISDPVVRLSKTGDKLYVELNAVVAPGTWDVADIDQLRAQLRRSLSTDSYDVWLNLDFTCEPLPPSTVPD